MQQLPTSDFETPETRDWSIRKLGLKTYYATIENRGHLTRINGTIADLQREIHGNNNRQEEGIKAKVQRLEKWMERSKARAAVIAAILVAIGASDILVRVFFGG